MGQVLGAEKINSLIRVADRRSHHGGRGCGILSIPAKQVSLGSPRVGTIHVQSPTPPTPPLPAYFDQFSQQCGSLNHELLGNGFQSSRGPKNRRMRCRRLPTTRPTPRGLHPSLRRRRAIKTQQVIKGRWHPWPPNRGPRGAPRASRRTPPRTPTPRATGPRSRSRRSSPGAGRCAGAAAAH